MSLTEKYYADTSANVLMLFALMVLPIFAVIGFNADFTRKSRSVNHIQYAMDAASLVGAKELLDETNSLADVRRKSIEAFHANLVTADGDLTCADPTVRIDEVTYEVTVTGGCSVNSIFGETHWDANQNVSNLSTAQVAVTHLDVALMLDVSGSMDGAKLDALKAAAKEFSNVLLRPQTGDRIRIGFATYASTVNVRDFAASVFNPNQLNAILDDEDDDFELGDDICVEERSGSARYSDAVPRGTIDAFPIMRGGCPPSALLPLTSDRTTFHNRINALNAGGATAGHMGIAWSWYILSPNWNSIWPSASQPLPYGDEQKKKAVVIMTDGQFNREYNGPSSHIQARDVCDNIRDEEIIVFSVAFELSDATAEQTLKDCADEPTRFYKADNPNDLLQAYRDIASQLIDLKLTE